MVITLHLQVRQRCPKISWVTIRHKQWPSRDDDPVHNDTVHRKYFAGGNLVNHSSKSYWQGDLWRISNSQCVCHMCFPFICECWWGKFWQMIHQLFPYQNFPVYGYYTTAYYLLYNLHSSQYNKVPILHCCSYYIYCMFTQELTALLEYGTSV